MGVYCLKQLPQYLQSKEPTMLHLRYCQDLVQTDFGLTKGSENAKFTTIMAFGSDSHQSIDCAYKSELHEALGLIEKCVEVKDEYVAGLDYTQLL